NKEAPNGILARVRPPLAMNKILLSTARAYSLDMYTRQFFAHQNPDGKGVAELIDAAGYKALFSTDNLAIATDTSPQKLHDDFISLHNQREAILNADPRFVFREAGIGYYHVPAGL